MDFGPKNPTRGTWAGSSVLTSKWSSRPQCDSCGPFRGRFMRKLGPEYRLEGYAFPFQDWRCKGCDEEV